MSQRELETITAVESRNELRKARRVMNSRPRGKTVKKSEAAIDDIDILLRILHKYRPYIKELEHANPQVQT